MTHAIHQTTAPSQTAGNSKWSVRAGWALSGLMIAFLLFDGVSKLFLERHVIAATTALGYSVDVIRPLGVICLVCTILYAIPRTSILGAILLTGYLGGTIAVKVRIADPLFSSTLFGLYFGLIVWGGVYLRDPRVRALIPFRQS